MNTPTPLRLSNLGTPYCLMGRANPCGTSLVGYAQTTYAHLIACFGPPHEREGDKITVSWGFRCADGTLFTVYDWKESATPLGLYRWHIGGNTLKALEAFTAQTGVEAFNPY